MSHRRARTGVEPGLTVGVEQSAVEDPDVLVPVHLHMPPQQFDIARHGLEGEYPATGANQLGKKQGIESHIRTDIPTDHPRTQELRDSPLLRSLIRTHPATVRRRTGDPALAAERSEQWK